MEILDFSNNLKVNKFALVIGIGGAGGNVLSYIYKKHKSNDIVDFLALNTDMQALSALEIPLLSKFLIGESITRGNGAGADPEKGQLSAVESSKFIQNILKSNHYKIAFIIAGMGGGTGTGAAPIIAEICKKIGIYTIGICSTPFSFEGYLRQKQAAEGIERLKKNVDNIAIFSNDNIINSAVSVTISDAFSVSDEIFYIPIEIILSILTSSGIINIDFADILTTLKGSKLATIAYGIGKGEKRITKAFENLKDSPFLYNLKITKAQKILLNISYNGELTMDEMLDFKIAMTQFDEHSEIIWGLTTDLKLDSNEVKVSAIITGITDEEEIVEYVKLNELSIEKQLPKEIEKEALRIRKDFKGKKVAFLIMQFGTSKFHNEIYNHLQKSLIKKNIIVLRADYKEYHPDLYYNILSYIYASDFGIAVFERIDDDLFNPNVAFEVGYMFALNKPVCLLKEKTMKNLPTDIIGKLYKTFDLNDLEKSIENSINKWINDRL